MKKRIFALLLALTFVLMTASVGLAAQTRGATGYCNVTKSSFSGSTDSDKIEASISVSITVKRLVGGLWRYVDSTSASKQNSDYVSATKSVSLTGGYYYKAFATHYATSQGTWYTESNQIWVAK